MYYYTHCSKIELCNSALFICKIGQISIISFLKKIIFNKMAFGYDYFNNVYFDFADTTFF